MSLISSNPCIGEAGAAPGAEARAELGAGQETEVSASDSALEEVGGGEGRGGGRKVDAGGVGGSEVEVGTEGAEVEVGEQGGAVEEAAE